jgi:hypothetical protein
LGSNGQALELDFILAAGTNFQTSNPNVWQSGEYIAVPGQVQLPLTAGATCEISQVKLEIGLVPTPFVRRDPATDFAIDQRYYAKSYSRGVAPGNANPNGISLVYADTGLSEGNAGTSVYFKTSMLTIPTMTVYSPVTGAINMAHDYINSTDVPISNLVVGSEGFFWYAAPASGTNAQLGIHWTADCRLV